METYEVLLARLEEGENIRETISLLRQALKDSGEEKQSKEMLASALLAKQAFFVSCLEAADPKTRKNAALLLGDLADGGTPLVQALWQAYQKEDTLFVKSAYLKALANFSGEELACLSEGLSARRTTLESAKAEEENRKHSRQERKALEELCRKLEDSGQAEARQAVYPRGTHRILLCCEPGIREKLLAQAAPLCAQTKAVSSGVMAVTEHLREVLQLRLYREVWVIVRQKAGCAAERENLAAALVSSELLPILRRFYPGEERFSFRVRLQGADDIRRKADFVQKLAFELEEASGGKLQNQAKAPAAEILLKEKKDGTFGILVKITGLTDTRFSYRKKTQPTSMHPAAAAAMLALAEPYLKEDAQSLDPFCGVGTLLIERTYLKKSGYIYGTDIFGDAIRDARENAAAAGTEIYFINRDYFDFTSQHLFDEILTEFPRFHGPKREEMGKFYRRFFEKSKEILKEDGVMIFLSGEDQEVKKQLRLDGTYRLLRQMPLRGDESVYVVGRK